MSTIKPIQSTPELTGKHAVEVLRQVNTRPTEQAMQKNAMLRDVLTRIRKA